MKRVALEGCNGKWAQKYYLPVLIKKARKGEIELWAVDVKGESPAAGERGNSQYLNKDKNKDKQSYNNLSDVDYVFIVTPDKYHCQTAEFWLDRLTSGGKIFIEKPLDASLPAARGLKNQIETRGEKGKVFAFDHYPAKAAPFLKDWASHPAKIDGLKKVEVHILESNKIRPQRERTLDKGMIFDLFSHVLALVYNIVKRSSYDKFPTVAIEEVKAARYAGCPIKGETFAWIKFRVSNLSGVAIVGKCVDSQDDKLMRLTGPNGDDEINFDPKQTPLSNEEALHNFLNGVLDAKEHPLSIPGVLSFDTAFSILTILDKAKKKIGKMPEYPCHETVNEILKGFKK